ncbi:MAG: DNA polymerase I [Spirochaetota bacterium]
MEKTLYLIDGQALVYRAYYAFIRQPLFTSRGENTSALFGFMRMLIRLMKDEDTRYMVCAFDSKKKTFRYNLYPEYKAKRLKAPSDLLSQVEVVKQLVEKLGIPKLEKEGWEADDVIGTITERLSRQGIQTVVVSGDKDILQLVNDNVRVYASKKGISEIDRMDHNRVQEVWGVHPDQTRDVLALMGDQSDNIPGVKGIGKVRALELVSQFGSIENLYQNIEKVEKENIKQLLKQGKQDAFLSKRLVTIQKNVPVDCSIEDFRIDGFPADEGISILLEKELNAIVEELKGKEYLEKKENQKIELERGKYYLVNKKEDYSRLKELIYTHRRISLDTETTGRDPMSSEIIGLSISVREKEGYYLPLVSRNTLCLGLDFLTTEIKEVLEDENVKKVGQNIKYDFIILLRYGIVMRGVDGDAMIAAYLLEPSKQRYGLDDLAKQYLNYTTILYSDVVTDDASTLLDYSMQELVNYAGEDSDVALRLNRVLEKKLEEEGLLRLYREIEIPLVMVLGKMEAAGVSLDPEYLYQMSRRFSEELAEIEKEIFSQAGVGFNVRSTKQLQYILFEKMQLPVVRKTKTGFSTDESVLEELSRSFEIARLLLRHRRLAKLKSTYIDSLPGMINQRTGRLHTSFNQTITTTGRLSSTRPNLQNIPIKEKEGKAIRRAFVPQKGWQLISADYSQIELRIVASLSGDPLLCDAFKRDRDIHTETACVLFNIDPSEVDNTRRQLAKTINFSVIYGISPFGLSRRLGIPRSEAGRFIEKYFEKYKGVETYFQNVVDKAKKNGYVETILGRKRFIPEINSRNRNLYEAARRIAINTPIQGTAADMIKKAMIIIDGELEKRKMKSRMLIQVHDELIFEAPQQEVAELTEMVKEKMENAITFEVPIKVNISTGKNWEVVH